MIDLLPKQFAKGWLNQVDKRKKYWGRRNIVLTLNTLGKLGRKELQKAAPKGQTNKLKNSFGFHITRKGVQRGTGVFTSKVEYAQFVQDGTEESVGGYIPAINRRLTRRFVTSGRKNITSRKLRVHRGSKPNRYQTRAFGMLQRKALPAILKMLRARRIIKGNKVQ